MFIGGGILVALFLYAFYSEWQNASTIVDANQRRLRSLYPLEPEKPSQSDL